MTIASRYWQFVGFDAAGRRRVEVLETAKNYFEPWLEALERQHPNASESDAFIQSQLWKAAHSQAHPFDPTSNDPPVLCLRCCVSHWIEQSCIQLAQQFGEFYGFHMQELLPLVLDANAKMACGAKGGYESLTTRILNTFKPEQGNLGTWTNRLVRNSRRISKFSLEHGLYLITDWAILNDTSPKQAQDFLLNVQNLTPYEANVSCYLLRAFHAIYRGDREKSKKRGRCYPPTAEQLTRMIALLRTFDILELNFEEGSEAIVLSQLQTLARQLRQYRILRRGGIPKTDYSMDALDPRTGAVQQFAAKAPPDTEDDQELFLSQYREDLSQSLEEAIEEVLERRYQQLEHKRNPVSDSWLKGLYLFHCRHESMGDIAHKIGLNAQYQVSRLLQLKAMRADIRQAMLRILGDRVLDSLESILSSEQLTQLDQRIEEILVEQVDQVLDRAAAEASASKNCGHDSFYTRRLCQCLSRRVNP